MIIGQLLRDATCDNLDAEVLLAHVLGENREWLVAHGDEEVSTEDVALFESYVKRREEQEPVAYIVGFKEFYGMDFFVDRRVLVPRPETEMLVDKALEYLEGSGRVLDVGTGSGCMAVSIARTGGEDVNVDAVDLTDGACEVARINAENQGVDDRVDVFQSDLLEFAEKGDRYDVIVTNLPYVPEGAGAPKYEPHEALFAGPDGLRLYERFFEEIINKDIKFRVLIGEFGFGQSKKLGELLNKYFDQKWEIEKDLAGIDRMFIIKL